MADSVISELTDPSSNLDTFIGSSIVTTSFYPFSSTDILLTYCHRPRSTSQSFFFCYSGKKYRVKEITVIKKQCKQSYTWPHGAELFCKNNGHPSWLCVVSWDQRHTELYSAANTHYSGQHLCKARHITDYRPVETAEEKKKANSAKDQ